ncbi:TPA: hypothetical protein ACH3X2_008576 [Trebouxia sp. C0005]|nr:MAG: hypothetical protein FRX49_03152 [Trebouxia sp. A1-2]
MGPPKGASTPEGVRPRATPEVTHSSGTESLDMSRHASSKRGAQHEEYHNSETKRRKAGTQQAAKVQEKATQLVQQLAAPDGSRGPYEHHGTLAKAEHRQDSYNQSIETKPWASSIQQACHNPTAGLPMQTGHYADQHASDQDSGSASPCSGSAAESPADPAKHVQQTNSDPSQHCTSLQSPEFAAESNAEETSESEANSESPAIDACKQFSSSQKYKRNVHANSSMAAIRDRQHDEQTNQNHQQNDPEDEKRLPPVIQQLQRAQQRAHDELEAAEKEACHYRAPAEAGERFVTNARKHKAKLDVPVYEHGREVNARSMKR